MVTAENSSRNLAPLSFEEAQTYIPAPRTAGYPACLIVEEAFWGNVDLTKVLKASTRVLGRITRGEIRIAERLKFVAPEEGCPGITWALSINLLERSKKTGLNNAQVSLSRSHMPLDALMDPTADLTMFAPCTTLMMNAYDPPRNARGQTLHSGLFIIAFDLDGEYSERSDYAVNERGQFKLDQRVANSASVF